MERLKESKHRQDLESLKEMAEKEITNPNRTHIETLATLCGLLDKIDELLKGNNGKR
jgi:hypothetical protein